MSLFYLFWLFYVCLIYPCLSSPLDFSIYISCFCLCLVFSSSFSQSFFSLSLSISLSLSLAISPFFLPAHTGKFMPEPVHGWNCHQRSSNCRTQTQNPAVAPTVCMLGKRDERGWGAKAGGVFLSLCVCVRKNVNTYISPPLFYFAVPIFVYHSDFLHTQRVLCFDRIAKREARNRKIGGVSQGWTETHSLIKEEPNAIYAKNISSLWDNSIQHLYRYVNLT